MGENTKIEWCDHTFNPWIGCTAVSPACDNCYAEALMDARFGRVKWGAGQPRKRTSASNWKEPRRWDKEARQRCERPFVFCSSLADVFDNEVDPDWRDDLLNLIDETPALVWLLLTKRIGNVERMVQGSIPRNVALGATFGNQAEYDRDARKLSKLKQTLNPLFTFGSFEPLLGPVQLSVHAPDWIIVGGESGPNARPMELGWARTLRIEARHFNRVFNFKQVGGRDATKGGHLLDGREHFDRPEVTF
jgi:protein gp37